MDPSIIPQLVPQGSLAALLLYFIVAIYKEWWIPGGAHKRMISDYKESLLEMKKDRDEWKDLALRNLTLADSAVKVAGTGDSK